MTDEPAIKGVRGWLLLLCLFLIVLVPLKAAIGLFAAWQAAANSPTLRGMLAFDAVFEIAFAAFAAYAGVALYRGRTNAVAVAKIYFIVTLTLAVLGLGLTVIGALQQQTSDRVLAGLLKGPAAFVAGSQALVSAAWLIYLERSRRVRATYFPG